MTICLINLTSDIICHIFRLHRVKLDWIAKFDLAPSSSGLGHSVLNAGTPVRLRLELLLYHATNFSLPFVYFIGYESLSGQYNCSIKWRDWKSQWRAD